jgi:hypothetical protein
MNESTEKSPASSWLHLPLAAATLLAVLLATTLFTLLLAWSLLLLAWSAVALPTLGPAQTWGSSRWLWAAPALWGVAAAAAPLPDPLYSQVPTLPFHLQVIMAAGLLLPLVCWPSGSRKQVTAAAPRRTAVLLLIWPALAAVAVLGRFVVAGGLNLPLLLALVLLAALLLAWPRLAAAQRLPLGQLRATLTRLSRSLYRALQDALLLLEGEVGLLWLLGLLALALLFN